MDRLQHLSKLLKDYQEQVQGMEEALALTPPMGKAQIKQNIRYTRREMRPVEQEYWELLAKEAQTEPIAEEEAAAAVVEVVGAIEVLETRPVSDRSEDRRCCRLRLYCGAVC